MKIQVKIKNDFRISAEGRFLRKYWIDELPMLLNILKGDIKIVGVRPISEHYLSLYPEYLIKKRNNHKPGFIPPYYVDLPKNFDEILISEKNYLDAHEVNPLKTDLNYFLKQLETLFSKELDLRKKFFN